MQTTMPTSGHTADEELSSAREELIALTLLHPDPVKMANAIERHLLATVASLPSRKQFLSLALMATTAVTLALTACAGRKFSATPSYLILPSTAASCETLPMSETGRVLGECRWTDRDGAVRRIEFRRVREAR